MQAIVDTANVSEAWKRVQANKGAATVDGVSIEDFPDLFRSAWSRLPGRLASGSYEPAPSLSVEMEAAPGDPALAGNDVQIVRSLGSLEVCSCEQASLSRPTFSSVHGADEER